MSHNKKRNTAFLYEVLLREGTKCAIEKDFTRAKIVKSIIIESFNAKTEMFKELELYKALDRNDIEEEIVEKYVKEVEKRYENLDKKAIFNEQTRTINKINKTLGFKVFDSFVPNYKHLATIAQIFNSATPVKEKVLLENKLIEKIKLVKETKAQENLQPIDNLVYKTFSKKFNEKYTDLLKEQKDLLTRYVNSFSDDSLELKIFLNEEVDRLKEAVSAALKKEEIASDEMIVKKTQQTLDYLKNFKEIKDLGQDTLQKIMKIQQFVHEVNK